MDVTICFFYSGYPHPKVPEITGSAETIELFERGFFKGYWMGGDEIAFLSS